MLRRHALCVIRKWKRQPSENPCLYPVLAVEYMTDSDNDQLVVRYYPSLQLVGRR